jgi:hypothetical protein
MLLFFHIIIARQFFAEDLNIEFTLIIFIWLILPLQFPYIYIFEKLSTGFVKFSIS